MSKETDSPRKGEVTIKGVRLLTYRKLRGLTQGGLAAKATQVLHEAGESGSVSESLVALIETNRRQPSLRSANALAAALDIPLEALADVREPMSA